MNRRNYQKELEAELSNIEKEGRAPTLFLHSCCAPCSSYVLEYLSRYFTITVFYYNPNISPASEYEERAREQERLIRENLRVTNLEEGARVIAGDAMEYLHTVKQRFDLVFLDPPYASGLLESALEEIARIDILSPHGIIVAEHPADHVLPVLAPPYRLHRVYRYGKIGLSVYHRGANQENEEQRS